VSVQPNILDSWDELIPGGMGRPERDRSELGQAIHEVEFGRQQ